MVISGSEDEGSKPCGDTADDTKPQPTDNAQIEVASEITEEDPLKEKEEKCVKDVEPETLDGDMSVSVRETLDSVTESSLRLVNPFSASPVFGQVQKFFLENL